MLPIPLECALAEKDCLFNYVKLSFFCFLCPDRVGLPLALRGVSFSKYAGEKVTRNHVVVKKAIITSHQRIRYGFVHAKFAWELPIKRITNS